MDEGRQRQTAGRLNSECAWRDTLKNVVSAHGETL